MFSSIVDFFKAIFAYFLGRQDANNDQTQKDLEIKNAYDKIDEKDESYHDDGKSGLLERVHDAEDSDSK